MPAAARSGAPDVREAHEARVPCPHCGGLIHPIAGKCKHCKADLSSFRAARPAANAPLPALGAPALPNGHPPHAAVAHAVPLPVAAQTILPPRPTGAETVPASAWRSWPVVVIVVAMLAIVAAVVIMVWPAGHSAAGKRALQPPPAPERMDTQTPPVTPKLDGAQPHAQAPGAAADPWAQPAPRVDPQADPGGKPDPDPQAGAQDDPQAGAQDDPHADPQADPQADDDPPAVADPFRAPAPGNRQRAQLSGGGMIELAMTARICRKLVQCGTSDPTLRTTCEAIAHLPADPPAGCPAAVRCLRRIDALGCSSQPDALQLGMLVMQFRDCAEAERC